jgi:hypothetical protein
MEAADLITTALRNPADAPRVTIYWDAQDTRNPGPAYRIDGGDSGPLDFCGWKTVDGSKPDTQGYYLGDYFTRNGAYAGPDCHGVYPILTA